MTRGLQESNDAAIDPVKPRRRYTQLDGLRGVAALLVVLHHALLTIPAFARLEEPGPKPRLSHDDPLWWLGYTPLHSFWAGGFLIFFALSGFVLTLPFTKQPTTARALVNYYPRRLLRLYLPLWAAIAFALATTLVIDRGRHVGSWWLQMHDQYTLSSSAVTATLASNNSLITALWSLQYEAIFSLTLPIAVAIFRRLHKVPIPTGLALVALMAAGFYLDAGMVRFPAMLAFGVLMAFNLDQLTELASWISSRRHGGLIWAVVVFGAAIGLSAHWWLHGLVPAPSRPLIVVAQTAEALSAILLLFAALYVRRYQRFLQSSPIAWLGTRSFSIYLVHETVIVSLAFALAGHVTWWLTVPLSVALAFIVGAAFFRVVERPSHRLSRAAGRRATGLLDARVGGSAADLQAPSHAVTPTLRP